MGLPLSMLASSPSALLAMLAASGFLNDPQVEALAARLSDAGGLVAQPLIQPKSDDTAVVYLPMEKGRCTIEITFAEKT